MLLAAVLHAFGQTSQAAAPDPPHARGWDDFPVFVWREKHAGKPLPDELIEPFGGTLVMREEPSDWLRAKGYAYLVFNAAGRSPLHIDGDADWERRVEQWIATRDEKLLVREPCLNDPEVRVQLFATLASTLEARASDQGLGLSLGDEISLTPNGDPFDLCRCVHCETLWREHARSNGLPERAPLTDEVRLALLADDFSLLGAWLERRRFDQQQVLGLLDELVLRATPMAERERYQRPGLRSVELGILGCTGRTPFGGVALEELATRLDFIECYPVRDARELVETVPELWRHGRGSTFGPDPRPLSLSTLFVEGESAAGLAWLVWEQWIRGGNGLVLWSDTQLESLPADHRARLVCALRAIRTIQEKTCFGPSPDPFGIALLHDDDSDAVAFLKDALLDGATWPRRRASYQNEHGIREKLVRSWLRLLQDSGLVAGSLPLEHLCPDCSLCYPVLIAPEVLVLDEAQIRQLERHVADGGVLIVDGHLGWVDRRGRPHEKDILERLRSRAPDRVLDAPGKLAGYLERRWDPAVRESARSFVHGLLARVGRPLDSEVLGPRLEGEAASLPWLTGRLGIGNTRTFAFLPNCATREERNQRLRNIVLEPIQVPDGYELEWLQPADGKMLRAGDSAVFQLRKSEAR